ncbi:MAG TPA: hypothetical protein VFC07_16015 [Verrucomicrobiae bacterium]|nr:hypothetical protein [Verrucomicrobiae bacterium]
MVTVKADNQRRVQLPDIKAGQIFALENHGDGTITLTVVKAETKEPFPKGSLLKYFTPEKDAEETVIASACVQGPSGPDK